MSSCYVNIVGIRISTETRVVGVRDLALDGSVRHDVGGKE